MVQSKRTDVGTKKKRTRDGKKTSGLYPTTQVKEVMKMAKICGRPAVVLTATVEMTKHELCALEALAGYGTDVFLKVFYEKMGKAYLEPHEAGLRSLFESVRSDFPRLKSLSEDAEAVFAGAKQAIDPRLMRRD
jgi:hypothetical protein